MTFLKANFKLIHVWRERSLSLSSLKSFTVHAMPLASSPNALFVTPNYMFKTH